MKRYYKQALVATSLGLFTILGIGSQEAKAQSDPFGSNNQYYNEQYNSGIYTNPQYGNEYVSYNDFYVNLAPYGQWIEDEHYGYVWSPNVDINFRPYYTGGHWALTDYGNTWVSDYQWGWACFHYGRWTFDSYYGWLWVPGSVWGPAWVSWRSNMGAFGWAPLSPEYEFSASDFKAYHCPKDWWVFLPPQYLYGGNYYRYWTGPLGNSTNIKGTELMDNTYISNGNTYVAGPRAAQIEKVLNKPVQLFKLLNSGSPKATYVHNDVIKMYRPSEIKATLNTGEHPAPPYAITAPHKVATVPVAVNINSGAAPAFRKDLPSLHVTPVLSPVPAQPTVSQNNNSTQTEVIRADKNTYQSSVKVPEPERPRQAGAVLPPPKKSLPPQQAQKPEPVTMPNKKNSDTKSTTRQQADPLPAQPVQDQPRAEPIPSQHPEPIKPGR